MQFLLTAYDAADPEALNRRMEARESHLAHMAKAKAEGHAHMGAALLDDAGKMIGSSIIAEFDTRADFDTWLATDPYVTGKVWDKMQVTPCKIAPSFAVK